MGGGVWGGLGSPLAWNSLKIAIVGKGTRRTLFLVSITGMSMGIQMPHQPEAKGNREVDLPGRKKHSSWVSVSKL